MQSDDKPPCFNIVSMGNGLLTSAALATRVLCALNIEVSAAPWRFTYEKRSRAAAAQRSTSCPQRL